MIYILGILAALFIIFLLVYTSIKKPVFGSILSIISIVFILLATYFYFQEESIVEKKRTLIPVEQIVLSDIAYSRAYGNYYKLTGRLENKSERYRLRAINLNISFLKCKAEVKECELLVEEKHKVTTRMSPQQAANIETYVMLDDSALLPYLDSLRWQVKVSSGVAR